jgi:superfamily II DNA or RNA helicase
LSARFSSSSRARGEKYFEQKRVKISTGSAAEVDASVRGSQFYRVMLRCMGTELAGVCTCPYFLDEGQLCKHLWATLLAAEKLGYLSEAAANDKLGLDTETLLDEVGYVEYGEGEEEEDEFEDKEEDESKTFVTAGFGATAVRPPPASQPDAWKTHLDRIGRAVTASEVPPWPMDLEICYVLDMAKSQTAGCLVVTVASRERRKDGTWKSSPRPCTIYRSRIPGLPLVEDREILSILLGSGVYFPYSYYNNSYGQGAESYNLPPLIAEALLPKMLNTGRCFLSVGRNETEKSPLQWDAGDPWRFVLEVRGSHQEGWRMTGNFRRGEQRMALDEPLLVTRGGFLVAPDCIAPLAEDETFPWIASFRDGGSIAVPESEREHFFGRLLGSPALPTLDLPESLHYEEVSCSPRLCLTIHQPERSFMSGNGRMKADLSFDYEGREVLEKDASRGIYEPSKRRFILRDAAGEQAASQRLSELGMRFSAGGWNQEPGWSFIPAKLPRIVRSLVEAGWHIVAEGKVFRQASRTSVSVSSGVDWFELQGTVTYGDATAQLPQLLAALKRGETMVELGDGSYGLLPEEWLRRFSPVASMGEAEKEHIRFRSGQAGILDALLATQPDVDCDETFQRVRKELERFQSIGPAEQPAGFQGHLRDYQREGLGWMHFLRQFSFGGCLADDMGVGKTAQVLALLETRRELRSKGEIDAPSLAVVPKSLIFNWKQEVQRFTPQLRVLDYTGLGRKKQDLSAYDLVLTTYGTLRRDAVHFKDTVFDYVILDEAQAIKNAKTESAKAVRLLRGSHRLAMTGTPVENHLGELWSLFEFLNPGMLGASGVFQLTASAMRDPGDDARKLLSHALRPFLLRRTKEQVAKELPAKVEQTIYCEMEPAQRELYNGLRDHYRESLLGKIDRDGIAKSKIQVLEALLRLRQAACHPGLVDRKRVKDSGAKLDMLLDQLQAVLDEGHKALVFSQFTSLLAILRSNLQSRGIEHEYLDGKTHDRQSRVERFQDDPDCRLFLISLKAGGVGLNLTAADYVFILDPWWNPAVEAQAVDRTHRIGQTRQVFAYRLITRDTVEEKVLQLQETKRNLADAIIGANNSLIRDLRPEDIALLLS